MNDKNHSILQSFKFAMTGVKIAIKENRNMKIHFVIAIFVVIFALFLQMSRLEIAIICIIIILVFSAEMINTAIEEVINLVTKEYREEARIAKDVSAGMVFIVAAGSIAVGLLIFLPHI
ncbi:MAG: diacylglycerol kinase family protein, partial [Patescibacteria group bacterium]